jgi:small-conductance mechanosensitive channel
MNRRIKLRFEEARIEMPFPTRTVHVVSDPSQQE